VRVFSRTRCLGFALALCLAAAPSVAQNWSVGATYGAVNDVERTFRLDGFHPHDVSAWIDYRLEPHVLLRASYVGLKTTSDNSGRPVSVDPAQPPATLPELKVRIDAVTVGVSYTAFEGYYTSGFFAGIGGYRIRPEPSPGLEQFQDPKETVFGFHVGVEGDFKIVKHVSAVGRLTLHGILSSSNHNIEPPSSTRWLLVASAGIAIRP
jgi:hypothetical protein